MQRATHGRASCALHPPAFGPRRRWGTPSTSPTNNRRTSPYTRTFLFCATCEWKGTRGHDDCKNNGGGKIHGKHGTSSVRLRMLRGMRDILFNPNGFSRPEQTGASKMPVRRERSSREQMPASSAQETHAARGPPSERAPIVNLYAASAAPVTTPGFSLSYLGMGRNSWNRMAASTARANTVPMPNPPPASSVPNW